MRSLTLLISAVILTLIATEVSASQEPGRQPSRVYSCRLLTGYGSAVGRGSTQLAAKENARELCGSKLIDQYVAQRGSIPADVEDDLVLSCVNLECQ